jgi:hypothetical protein
MRMRHKKKEDHAGYANPIKKVWKTVERQKMNNLLGCGKRGKMSLFD